MKSRDDGLQRLRKPFNVVQLVSRSSVSDMVSRYRLQHPGRAETFDTARCIPLNVATSCPRLFMNIIRFPFPKFDMLRYHGCRHFGWIHVLSPLCVPWPLCKGAAVLLRVEYCVHGPHVHRHAGMGSFSLLDERQGSTLVFICNIVQPPQ